LRKILAGMNCRALTLRRVTWKPTFSIGSRDQPNVQYRCAERENDCARKCGYSDSVVRGANPEPDPANVRQKKRKRFGRAQIKQAGP
jgi:hypothetical protein